MEEDNWVTFSKTDWERVDALTNFDALMDDEVDTSDAPPLTDEFFNQAKLLMPGEKPANKARLATLQEIAAQALAVIERYSTYQQKSMEVQMDEIPEIRLIMSPRTQEAQSFIGFEWNSDAGRSHKLGGRPDWIQFDETPDCDCGEGEMVFYGQLDCIGDQMSLGDCGMIYVFVCQECLTPKAVLQTR